MIVVDANVFLRYVVEPATNRDVEMSQVSRALFESVADGVETYTTSDAVIAEVVFILSNKRHYGIARPRVVELITPLLQFHGCGLRDKQRCIKALNLWVDTPKLSFVDALVAIQAEALMVPLASFDAAQNSIARSPR